MEKLTIVIQAGGESRRMGTSKVTVSFCGLPLICRSLKRLGSIADELIITTNNPESLDFLCESVKYDGKLRLCPDVLEKRGALNGLYTALYCASNPFVGIVACDMVFPSAPLLLAEQEALEKSGADAAVPVTSHGFEPFHAVYRRSSCLPAVEAALQNGQSRANSWFERVRLYEFTSDRVLAADQRGGSFVNVNTPEELLAMERRILAGEMTKLSDGSTKLSSTNTNLTSINPTNIITTTSAPNGAPNSNPTNTN